MNDDGAATLAADLVIESLTIGVGTGGFATGMSDTFALLVYFLKRSSKAWRASL
jgi:hypothetical protein